VSLGLKDFEKQVVFSLYKNTRHAEEKQDNICARLEICPETINLH